MKNFTIIDTINLIITLAIFAIVGIIAINILKPTSYSMNVKVLSVENETVTIIDEEHQIWEFYYSAQDEEKILSVNDMIRVSFLNNGTKNRIDDKIEKISIILK